MLKNKKAAANLRNVVAILLTGKEIGIMKTQKLKFFIAFLFFLTLSSNNFYAQEDTIRIDSSLVTVPTTVFDRDGRYIINLEKEDFQIFEDGVYQETALFESVEQPFTVLFLLDTSGSMTKYLDDLARAASAFFRKLRPDDKLIAVSFSDQTNTFVELTKVKNFEGRVKIIQNVQSKGTKIYDAVDFALKKVKKIPGRKAIVLFSDGIGSGIYSTAKENFRDAEEQEALIYTIKFGFPSLEPSNYVSKKKYFQQIEESEAYMKNLASITGGRSFQIEEIANLEQTFGIIADELGRQYNLGYYPKTEGKKGDRHQIKVKVREPNLVVRARNSYVIGSKN